MHWARHSFPALARPAYLISSISRSRFRRRRRCLRHASSTCDPLTQISIVRRSALSMARAFGDMRQNKIDGWQGPPGPLVYLILRSDAVDVVYGTMDGYANLGIPYMPHIAPTKRW